MYGDAYVEQLLKKANELDVPLGDVLATATRFTAECISAGVRDYCPVKPDRMIVGGGGSMNPTLLAHIADCLPGCEVMTNEQLGWTATRRRPWPLPCWRTKPCTASPTTPPEQPVLHTPL